MNSITLSKIVRPLFVLVALFATAGNTRAQEMYAVLHEGTATFYYDNNQDGREGKAYMELSLGNISGDDDWTEVRKIVFDPSFADARPTSTGRWFAGLGKLEEIEGIERLNTSHSLNMTHMFEGCCSLKSVDVSHFDTSRAYFMDYMFNGCSSLTSLDVSHFDTSNVSDMNNMFEGCSSLASLDLSSFNTSLVRSTEEMFSGCSSLTSLDLSNFDTRKIGGAFMRGMFKGCSSLTKLDISNFSTIYVHNMNNMFEGCSSLTSLDLSSFDTSSVLSMDDMFKGCYGLKEVTLGEKMSVMPSFEQSTSLSVITSFVTAPNGIGSDYFADGVKRNAVLYVPKGASANYKRAAGWREFLHIQEGNGTNNTDTVPYHDTREPYLLLSQDSKTVTFCYDNRKIERSGRDIVPIVYLSQYIDKAVFDSSFADYSGCTSTSHWFYKSYNLKTIEGIENLNTENVTDMSAMFYGCALSSINLSHFNTSKVTNMSEMFYNCFELVSLNISNFDTSNVTDMTSMFYGCRYLTGLNVSHFNTSKVTNMYGMFVSCRSLTSLNVSNFDTSNVTNMAAMFNGCKSLTSLNLSNFDTSNVTDMTSMFYHCLTLTSLNLSNFDTSNVTDMSSMFCYCESLASLDVSNFNTSNVTDMSSMFKLCKMLTRIDLSSFNTSNVTNMSDMFSYCDILTTIYAGNWDKEKVTNSMYMFNWSTNLVGGQGTTYDQSHVDHTYARIDGSPSAPGYFTYKTSTGIQPTTTTQQNAAPVYNLSGQHLPAPQKGINIIGGRKVVMK